MVIVNKVQLAAALGISMPTLSTWILRHGAGFPVIERGGRSGGWRFDLDAVMAFLDARRTEAAEAREGNRTLLDALPVPDLAPSPRAPDGSAIREQLDAWKLRRIEREEAERTGALIPADAFKRRASAAFAQLARDMHAMIRQVARAEGWPDPKLREVEARLNDMQRRVVADLRRELAGAPEDHGPPAAA